MRALVCKAFAPLDQLVIEERPDLEPAPGQVVLDVEAAGANFVDALLVQGLYQIKPPLPFTPGMEVAGTVRGIGAGVEGIAVGDRVLGTSFFGGYASQVVLPAAAVVAIPGALSAGQAAGLVQSYATMLFALTRRTVVAPGEWVAVLGAGGGIGLATVDLANALGARVIGCASSRSKLEAALAAGADATISYENDGVDLKTAIREVTGGGADVLVDPVGGPKADAALRALRWMGRYVVIGFAAGEIPRLPLNQVLLNNRTVIGIDWGAWTGRDPAGNATLLAELFAMVTAGRLRPVEPVAYPLTDAARALADLQGRRVTGKVVLVPDAWRAGEGCAVACPDRSGRGVVSRSAGMVMHELFPRTRREVGPGAAHVPDWLDLDAQVALAARCREWGRDPAGLRTPRMPDGTPLSIRSVCLGWHWYPYAYSRTCDDHDGAPVKPLPADMVQLAEIAASAAGYAAADVRFDASIINVYTATSKLGLHQDSAESAGSIAAGRPVVTISIGDTCIFRFGNNETRTRPWTDVELRSGDLFVFGGATRLAYHGVVRTLPGTAPPELGLDGVRLSITIRDSGISS